MTNYGRCTRAWRAFIIRVRECVCLERGGGGGVKEISVLPHVVICKTTDPNSGKPNQTPLLQRSSPSLGENWRKKGGYQCARVINERQACEMRGAAFKNSKGHLINRTHVCFFFSVFFSFFCSICKIGALFILCENCAVPCSESLRLLNMSPVGLDRRGANTIGGGACLRASPRPPSAGCCAFALKPGDLRSARQFSK